MPVMPMSVPPKDDRNSAPMYGVQYRLCGPMVSDTMSYSMPTPFSTSTCRAPGRFCKTASQPGRPLCTNSTITTKDDTVVCVMGMPPSTGMTK